MLGEEQLEESLGQILRVVFVVSLSPHECIKWKPIGLAKPFEGDERIATRRLQYDRPMRRVKDGTPIGRGLLISALGHCAKIVLLWPHVEMQPITDSNEVRSVCGRQLLTVFGRFGRSR